MSEIYQNRQRSHLNVVQMKSVCCACPSHTHVHLSVVLGISQQRHNSRKSFTLQNRCTALFPQLGWDRWRGSAHKKQWGKYSFSHFFKRVNMCVCFRLGCWKTFSPQFIPLMLHTQWLVWSSPTFVIFLCSLRCLCYFQCFYWQNTTIRFYLMWTYFHKTGKYCNIFKAHFACVLIRAHTPRTRHTHTHNVCKINLF